MIPHHILDDLGPGHRVAVLARDGELHFLVHDAGADPAQIRAAAARDESEVVATHLSDKEAILALVAGRERDVGGEG
jgi:3-hydroxyisobutyrate dehydrogenase-like beta-hydroxyacid dehydrogenase